MTCINSAVTGKFCDPLVIMTGITSRFILRPESRLSFRLVIQTLKFSTTSVHTASFINCQLQASVYAQ